MIVNTRRVHIPSKDAPGASSATVLQTVLLKHEERIYMMSSLRPDVPMEIQELRQQILSYRPRNVFRFGEGGQSCPNKLFVGLVDLGLLGECGSYTVSALRQTLHGEDTSVICGDDASSPALGEGVQHLADSVSVFSRPVSCRNNVITREYITGVIQELADMVGPFVLLLRASLVPYFTTDIIKLIQETKGNSLICIILCDTRRSDIDMLRKYLMSNNTIDIYELPYHIWDHIHPGEIVMSYEEQMELLMMLRQCLVLNDQLNASRLTDALRQMNL